MIVSVFPGSEVVRAEPFAAVELDLGGLWVEPPAATSAPWGFLFVVEKAPESRGCVERGFRPQRSPLG